MGLSAAERNRRKRERKKREKEERRKQEQTEKKEATEKKDFENADVDIEYVVQPAVAADPQVSDGVPALEADQNMDAVLRRFQERAAVIVSDDDAAKLSEADKPKEVKDADDDDSMGSDDEGEKISKRKLREMIRPSVADLKRRVQRPDLVEAHDITAYDPDFLIQLKSIPGTVPVPRHWGRKRKYLQGKVRLQRLVSFFVLGE